MASTFCQKNGYEKPDFCQKAPSFLWFCTYDFVQISLECGSKFLKECMERL